MNAGAAIAQQGALNTESPLKDLAALVRSHTPLIAVESSEEPQVREGNVTRISHSFS